MDILGWTLSVPGSTKIAMFARQLAEGRHGDRLGTETKHGKPGEPDVTETVRVAALFGRVEPSELASVTFESKLERGGWLVVPGTCRSNVGEFRGVEFTFRLRS